MYTLQAVSVIRGFTDRIARVFHDAQLVLLIYDYVRKGMQPVIELRRVNAPRPFTFALRSDQYRGGVGRVRTGSFRWVGRATTRLLARFLRLAESRGAESWILIAKIFATSW